jgi:DNA-binding protein HU-beta
MAERISAVQPKGDAGRGRQELFDNTRGRGETGMTRTELIDVMATKAGITKAAAEKALKAFTDIVTAALKKGQKVSLVGFGSFEISKRAARTGRNPQTGAEIKIKASKAPRFRPGGSLKEAANR